MGAYPLLHGALWNFDYCLVLYYLLQLVLLAHHFVAYANNSLRPKIYCLSHIHRSYKTKREQILEAKVRDSLSHFECLIELVGVRVLNDLLLNLACARR